MATLVDEALAPGTYTARWDGRSDAGEAVASGTYIYRLITDNRPVQARKMLLLR